MCLQRSSTAPIHHHSEIKFYEDNNGVTTHVTPERTSAPGNNYARPGGQNNDNFLTDRSTSRVLAPPGGSQSFTFGDQPKATPPPKKHVVTPPYQTMPDGVKADDVPYEVVPVEVPDFTPPGGRPKSSRPKQAVINIDAPKHAQYEEEDDLAPIAGAVANVRGSYVANRACVVCMYITHRSPLPMTAPLPRPTTTTPAPTGKMLATLSPTSPARVCWRLQVAAPTSASVELGMITTVSTCVATSFCKCN